MFPLESSFGVLGLRFRCCLMLLYVTSVVGIMCWISILKKHWHLLLLTKNAAFYAPGDVLEVEACTRKVMNCTSDDCNDFWR